MQVLSIRRTHTAAVNRCDLHTAAHASWYRHHAKTSRSACKACRPRCTGGGGWAGHSKLCHSSICAAVCAISMRPCSSCHHQSQSACSAAHKYRGTRAISQEGLEQENGDGELVLRLPLSCLLFGARSTCKHWHLPAWMCVSKGHQDLCSIQIHCHWHRAQACARAPQSSSTASSVKWAQHKVPFS
jgi:hypothetical protein